MSRNVLESCTRALHKHVYDEGLCVNALGLIMALCSSDDLGSGGRKLLAGRAGAFEAIVQAMSVWPDSVAVQSKGCQTIIVLCGGHAVRLPDPTLRGATVQRCHGVTVQRCNGVTV